MRYGLVILLGAALLAGCAVAPGIRYAGGEVREIDAALLQSLNTERAEAARSERTRRELVGGYEYRVGPADVINVVVWGHPEISNPMGQSQNIEQQARVVRADGTIFFPYVGVIPVAGMTVEEIRAQVAEDLAAYVKDPQIDVRVIGFRSQKVYVTGAVTQPGTLALTDEPLTALDALNQAGGLAPVADRRRIVLTRDGRQQVLDGLSLYASGRGDVLLEDRDVLFVPDNQRNRVFVMGEVSQQASIPLHEGRLTLAEALAGAEGLSLGTADTRNIFIVRGAPVYGDDGALEGMRPVIYRLNARSVAALLLAERFELEPRDIVYVSSSGTVRFNRVIQQILPTVQTLWQTDRILND